VINSIKETRKRVHQEILDMNQQIARLERHRLERLHALTDLDDLIAELESKES
jgi:uncharacterized coiled-coil DUF342 family protein